MLKTPEAKKRTAGTPPPSIRRLRDDVQTALLQDSDALLAPGLARPGGYYVCTTYSGITYIYRVGYRYMATEL